MSNVVGLLVGCFVQECGCLVVWLVCSTVLFVVVVWLYHNVVVLFLVAKAFAGSRQQAETIPWERRWL